MEQAVAEATLLLQEDLLLMTLTHVPILLEEWEVVLQQVLEREALQLQVQEWLRLAEMQVHILEALLVLEVIRQAQLEVRLLEVLETTQDLVLTIALLADQVQAAVAQQGLLLEPVQEPVVQAALAAADLIALEDQDRKTPHKVVINT
ncbi:MAG: hypothetical protein ACI9IP_002738 [Arcticibacterium sp.]|jgi:hypothetical protein